MGCYSSKRPHVDAQTLPEILKILDEEDLDLKQMIEKEKDIAPELIGQQHRKAILLMKTGLIELHILLTKRIENKNWSNEEFRRNLKIILEILDEYYDIKENRFVIEVTEELLAKLNKYLQQNKN